MDRTSLLRTCSMILLGLGVQETSMAQSPLGPLVANVSKSAKSLKNVSIGKQPERNRGTLVLCGGGQIPLSIREEFYRVGNGGDGTLVLIPTASPRSDAGDFAVWVEYWANFRWKKVSVVHAVDRAAAFDPALSATLGAANAVWISGGEQQRLSDRYVGTPIEKELHAVLTRGGVVGGTSAGAAIAAGTMISGGLSEPQFAVGLRFLPDTIIDQHFSQRKRQGRLIKAIEAHPNRIGIGIDESTGLIVTPDETRVVGDGSVFLLNSGAKDEFQRMRSGDKF